MEKIKQKVRKQVRKDPNLQECPPLSREDSRNLQKSTGQF